MTERGKRILNRVAFICLVNFSSFWIISLFIGGDAINGYSQKGFCYLAGNGRCSQVSPWVWIYSLIHASSVFFTHAAVFVTYLRLMWLGDLYTPKTPLKKNKD